MRAPAAFGLALVLAASAVAPGAHAQPAPRGDEDPFAEEALARDWRPMLLASASGAEGPGAFFTLAGMGQLSLARRRFGGPDACPPGGGCDPRWYAHGLLGAGITTDARFAAQAQLGLLWRPHTTRFASAVGPVAQFVHPGNRVGPALRVEWRNLVGLSAGALFEGDDVAWFVSLDVYHRILEGAGVLP